MPLANRIVDNTFGIQQDPEATGAGVDSNGNPCGDRRRAAVYLDPLTGVPSDSAYVSILSQSAAFGQSGVVEPIWYWLPELIELYDSLVAPGGGIVPLVSSFNGRGGAVSAIEGDYSLGLMGDVLDTLTPTDGQALIFDIGLGPGGLWSAKDILVTAPIDTVFGRTGDVVATEGDYDLPELGDVAITTPVLDEVLTYDGAGWVNQAIDAGVVTVFGRAGTVVAVDADYDFDQIGSIDVPSPNLNDHLIYNNVSGNWEAGPGVNLLNDLGDVTIGGIAVADGQTIRYDGLGWINAILAAGDVSSAANTILTGPDVQTDLTALEASLDSVIGFPDSVFAEPVTTGVISGGILSSLNTTTFDLTSGSGGIIDSYTDYQNPVVTPVFWTGGNFPLLNPTTEQKTYVSIDSSGTVITSNTAPGPSLDRTRILLGNLFHDPLNVDPPTVLQSYTKIGTIGHLLTDLLDYMTVPTTGFGLDPNPATLTAKQFPGTFFLHGINEAVDPTNPNVAVTGEVDPYDFFYMKGEGTIDPVALNTAFNPLLYDPLGAGGVLTPVTAAGGVRATIQYAFAIAPGKRVVLYGQTEYATIDDALDNVAVDRSNLVVPPELDGAVGPVYAIGMRQGATDLSLDADAFFVNFLDTQSGGGGGGGGGGGNLITTVFGRTGDIVALNDDYDIGQMGDVVITTPNSGQIIEYDGANWINANNTGGSVALDDLTDVTVVTPAVNHVLVNDGAGQFVNELLASIKVAYTPTGDIAAGNVQDAITELDAEKLASALAVTALDELSDVTIATPILSQVLVNDGAGQFVNALLKGDQVDNVPAGSIVATDVQAALNELDTDKLAISAAVEVMDDLGDVTSAAASDTQVLRFNGSIWVPVFLPGTSVVNVAAGIITSTNVQDALDELAVIIDANATSIGLLDAEKVSSDVTLGGTGTLQVLNMVRVSQVDYDALGVPDPNTLFLIDS